MFDGEAGEAASKRHTPSPKPLGERRPREGLGEEELIPWSLPWSDHNLYLKKQLSP